MFRAVPFVSAFLKLNRRWKNDLCYGSNFPLLQLKLGRHRDDPADPRQGTEAEV